LDDLPVHQSDQLFAGGVDGVDIDVDAVGARGEFLQA